MTAPSCPSCGAPVTPEVVDGIVRDEHRCERRPRLTRGLAPEVW